MDRAHLKGTGFSDLLSRMSLNCFASVSHDLAAKLTFSRQLDVEPQSATFVHNVHNHHWLEGLGASVRVLACRMGVFTSVGKPLQARHPLSARIWTVSFELPASLHSGKSWSCGDTTRSCQGVVREAHVDVLQACCMSNGCRVRGP